MPNPFKSLGYIKTYGSNSLRPVKSPGILSDTIIRRSAVRYNIEICVLHNQTLDEEHFYK